jgi:hypothetical protein
LYSHGSPVGNNLSDYFYGTVPGYLQRLRRGIDCEFFLLAEQMEHDTAAMRLHPVLEQINALPGA